MLYLQLSILVTGVLFLAGLARLFGRKSPASSPLFLLASMALSLYGFAVLSAGSDPSADGIDPKQIALRLVVIAAAATIFLLLRHRPMLLVLSVFAILFAAELVGDPWTGTKFVRPLGYSYILFRLADAVRVPHIQWRALLLQTFAFPTLAAGPVTLAGLFRVNPHAFSLRSAFYRRAAGLFFLGLAKVFLLLPYLDSHFETGILKPFQWNAGAFRNFFATGFFKYASLYVDFSGYTDIAVGLCGILGLRIPHNFRRPYLAVSVSDFWRRWHITLGLWIRRHVYIPMGGGRAHVTRNLLIAMVLIGLWHGLSFKFALWGLLHGTALALERRFLPATQSRLAITDMGSWRRPGTLARYLVTQLFIILTWSVFFW